MARLTKSRRKKRFLIVDMMMIVVSLIMLLNVLCYVVALVHYRKYLRKARRVRRTHLQIEHLNRLMCENDLVCFEQLRMDRHTFRILCEMLRTTDQLKGNRNVSLEEIVAMFLHILAHHVKNRVIKFRFMRSGETISRHFNACLNAVLRLHKELLKTPEPVLKDSTDEKWKWFKNCLGDTWGDGTDNIKVSDTQSHTNTLSERGGSGQPCRKRVRRANAMANNLENLAGNIGTFVQEIVPHFDRIAGAMKHENELAEKVVEKLLKIDGLNVDDVMKAADILAAEPSKAMVFLPMPDNMKKQYVERIFANGG